MLGARRKPIEIMPSSNVDFVQPRKKKLGEQIAQQIIRHIIDSGWPQNENLGTERELLERYNISRATFREAVRQVERHGAAKMRRGAGGGLVVTSPPRFAALRAMITYLEFTRVSFAEQHEVREQLERTAARLAATRVQPEQAQRLVALAKTLDGLTDPAENVSGNMAIRVAIAETTGNPSLALFIETLNGVLRDILVVLGLDARSFQEDRDQSVRFKHELIAAIISHDSEEAQRLVDRDVARRLLAMSSVSALGPAPAEAQHRIRTVPDWWEAAGAERKLSERVAFDIVRDLAAERWQEGRNLGNEAILQKRYKVSRAVLREAIRQLELHGIVRMKSGVQGGLIIGRFDPAYTVELVETYLTSTKIAMMHLWETQSVLEIFAAERLARICTPRDAAALRTAVDRLDHASPEAFLAVSTQLHREIADRAGNRALSLFVHILLHHGLLALPPIDALRIPWLIKMHRRLVDAICAHDQTVARREMATLFEQSRIWVSEVDR